MTKDRLKDLQKTYRNHDGQSVINDAIIPFIVVDVANNHSVAEYLAQIDLTRLLIDKIVELAKDVEQIHIKMLEPMADSKLAQEVDDKTADIRKLAYDVSTKLKKMEQIQEDQDDEEKASAQWRIKELQIFNITRRFSEVMNKYNSESVAHQDRCKKIIMRELEITGNNKTKEEVDKLIENGFPGTTSIIIDVEKMRQAADEIEARRRDITQLEASIRELHDMFQDLARLVSAQGEMIDNIEHSVLTTAEYVDRGKNQIRETVKINVKTRKKKNCICTTLIIIVVILIVLIGSYITIQKKLFGR